MRSLGRWGVAVLAIALVTGVTGVALAESSAREIAEEVCDDMVRTQVEASVQSGLTPPVGRWQGRTFECSYQVPGGQLVLSVDELRTRQRARSDFAGERRSLDVRERLDGLGRRAFQTTDGVLLVQKDQFVLRVDPGALPVDLDKRDVAFAAAVAVMGCW
jgi:hypothetical protein